MSNNAALKETAHFDVRAIREQFPILSRTVHGKPLVYLDNGASAQKPQIVLDAHDARLFGHLCQRPSRRAFPLRRIHRRLRAGARNRAAPSSTPPRRTKSSSPRAAQKRSTSSASSLGAEISEGDEIILSRDGAPLQHRAVALPARTQRRGAEMGADQGRRRLRSRGLRRSCSRPAQKSSRSPTCPTCWAR